MSDHAKLSPSSAARWMHCAGSVALTADMPDETTSYAEEGTKAHGLAEFCLTHTLNTDSVVGSEYDDDMRMHVQSHIDYVRKVANGERLYVEQRLDLREWIADGFGTADTLILKKRERHLDVIDLKYGMGKVNAEGNEQLYIYALGALANVRGQVDTVAVHISQPRLHHYDVHTLSVSELEHFGFKVAKAADLCLTDNAPLNPSEKACQWCKAKATCPALYDHNLKVIGEDFDPIAPADMTDAQLKLVIDNKGLIEKWLKAVESHIFDRLEHGGTFDGYKMVEGRSMRKYTDEAETVLVKLLGDEAYEKKLIGITDAEKKIGKKHFNELGITSKPAGKPTLVPESDKREAVLSKLDDFDEL